MNKGLWINTLNQSLAFSPVYAASTLTESVFWPGCSALKLEPELIHRTLESMKEEIPEIGFSSWCCGKPTLAVGTEKQKSTVNRQLTDYFANSGIRHVYSLCPNCIKTLGNRSDVTVHSAWPILARYTARHPGSSSAFPDQVILHDPCASRRDVLSQQAAREILTLRGIEPVEFSDNRQQTRCCGRLNMIFLTAPEISKKMLDERLAAAHDLPIATYCESCVESFRKAGRQSIHLLEVIFDQKADRGILNRLRNAHRRLNYD